MTYIYREFIEKCNDYLHEEFITNLELGLLNLTAPPKADFEMNIRVSLNPGNWQQKEITIKAYRISMFKSENSSIFTFKDINKIYRLRHKKLSHPKEVYANNNPAYYKEFLDNNQ